MGVWYINTPERMFGGRDDRRTEYITGDAAKTAEEN